MVEGLQNGGAGRELLGVLLDTVVRSVPVPALVRHIGPAVWWPGRPRHEAPAGVPERGR
ncbi:hypothetical protein [Streptomyces niger]|uniref:hypothetical protein n=1 Tax=Streptomyces niger TaxID=66373 RepID=UPI000AE9866F|nr:hypothetical protein [Streptomyces niger]